MASDPEQPQPKAKKKKPVPSMRALEPSKRSLNDPLAYPPMNPRWPALVSKA